MALGVAVAQASFEDAAGFLGERLAPGSVYRLLADEGHRLFGDEGHRLFGDDYFGDLFTRSRLGRPTVPARVVASVMLLQALEGLSDREACDRLDFDLRWKAAAGLTVNDDSFHPTILVGMRNRLRASDRPRRLFEDVNFVARAVGLLRGRVRVLDSTPLLDAVATQDTVTQLRAGIRKLLTAADQAGDIELAAAVRAVLTRDDTYDTVGKPVCDWDDRDAREALVDALVRDANAALAACHDRPMSAPVAAAAELLALIAGPDTEPGADGVFRIARKVARDRIISTEDPEARHGHKSRARRFDGYKAHLAVDPDDELITAVAVTPANASDRDVVDDLLNETPDAAQQPPADDGDDDVAGAAPVTVMGDSAYADGATLAKLTDAGHEVIAKVPPARNTRGGFTKDQFQLDLQQRTATCPAGVSAPITPVAAGGGVARFGTACADCPLRAQCTSAKNGRVLTVHPHEAALQHAKTAQKHPHWQARYRSQRPTVERKISHFVRKPWGGRKARTRGSTRILTDVITRAAAINLARLAVLDVHFTPAGWEIGSPAI